MLLEKFKSIKSRFDWTWLVHARIYKSLLIEHSVWNVHSRRAPSFFFFLQRNESLETCRKMYIPTKLYITSTLNIDLILWHTQLIVCACNVKSWSKSWVIHFTFQAYTLPYTLNCICVSLFKLHIWILEQF